MRPRSRLKRKLLPLLLVLGGPTLVLLGAALFFLLSGGLGVARPLPCEQLPTAERVGQVLTEHADVWSRVEGMSEAVSVDWDRCPDKADLQIYCAAAQDCARIKQLIGDTFYGVPYRMYDV